MAHAEAHHTRLQVVGEDDVGEAGRSTVKHSQTMIHAHPEAVEGVGAESGYLCRQRTGRREERRTRKAVAVEPQEAAGRANPKEAVGRLSNSCD